MVSKYCYEFNLKLILQNATEMRYRHSGMKQRGEEERCGGIPEIEGALFCCLKLKLRLGHSFNPMARNS